MHTFPNMQYVSIITADNLIPGQIVECQYYDSAPCYKVRNLLTDETGIYFEHELIAVLRVQAE